MPINLTELEQHELYLSRLASGGINAHVYPSLEATYKAIRRLLQDEEVITTQAQLNKNNLSQRELFIYFKAYTTSYTGVQRVR